MRRIALALPDTAAAALYLWCWLAPLSLMPKLVGLLVLVLLIEFVVIQAGPFIGNVVYGDRLGLTPRQRRRSAAILGATYLAFAGLAAASFDAWFPFLIFVWLLAVKVCAAVLDRDPHALGREREMTVWILSVCYYFAAIFVTLFVPLPMLGITQDGEVYGLRGQYEWANYPYKAIAAGFFYFLALAVTRLLPRRATLGLSSSVGDETSASDRGRSAT